MLRNRIHIVNNLSMVFDVIAIAASFAFAYYFRIILKDYYSLDMFPGQTIMGPLQPIDRYLGLLWFIVPTWIVLLYFFGVYNFARNISFVQMACGVTKSLVVGSSMLFLYIIVLKIDCVGRSFLLLFPPTCFAFLLLDKIVLLRLMCFVPGRIRNCNNILLVGTGERAQKFSNIIKKHACWGLKIWGIIDVEPGLVGTRVNGYEVKGVLKDIGDIIKNEIIDEVVFVLPRRYSTDLADVFIVCQREGIKVSLAGDLFNTTPAKIRISTFEDFPLIQYETVSTNVWGLFIKRILDVVVSSILLVLLSLPFFIIGILIKVSSRGPVLFSQVRCTKNGRKFNLYKFRTMIQDAEEMRESLIHLNELPQLYNVLMGDLSLVGPRPLPLV